jgi:hypothetical protein
MASVTRYDLAGTRIYRPGDNPNRGYPSVTSILSKTASEASKKTLLNWGLKNPGGLQAAAERGTAIHAACEAYMRGLPVELPPEYLGFWDGLAAHLDRHDAFLWSEKPLRPDWLHCVGEDGISRVWSHKYAYAGCPDYISIRNGIIILGDFKTSNGPYSRYYPEKGCDPSITFASWSKYKKCSLQLAAYAIAIEETLGLRVDAAQILVSTPTITQSFFIHGDELKTQKYKWLQRVRAYWSIIEAEAKEATASNSTPALHLELAGIKDNKTLGQELVLA